MYRSLTTLLLGTALVLPVFAQEAGLPPQLVDHWKTSKKYVLALAEQMPAADYSFKPNPAEMSFGEQLAHIAGSNSYFFATLSGQKDPQHLHRRSRRSTGSARVGSASTPRDGLARTTSLSALTCFASSSRFNLAST